MVTGVLVHPSKVQVPNAIGTVTDTGTCAVTGTDAGTCTGSSEVTPVDTPTEEQSRDHACNRFTCGTQHGDCSRSNGRDSDCSDVHADEGEGAAHAHAGADAGIPTPTHTDRDGSGEGVADSATGGDVALPSTKSAPSDAPLPFRPVACCAAWYMHATYGITYGITLHIQ